MAFYTLITLFSIMGILDGLPLIGGMFKNRVETQTPATENLLQVPLPMPQTASPPRHESIIYMTENPNIPLDVEDGAWAWNVRHMSFASLPNEFDRMRITRRYANERRILENNQPLCKIYKPGLFEETRRRQYENVVDITLSKAVNAGFQKNMAAATNIVETKAQQVQPQRTEEKKSTGIMGLIGL